MNESLQICSDLLTRAPTTSLVSADPQELSMIVACCHYHLLEDGAVEKALDVMNALVDVFAELLRTNILEKRICGLTALTKLVEDNNEESFMQHFHAAVPTFISLLFAVPHTQVLSRAETFLRYAARHNLIPQDCVPVVWTAAMESHETTRMCVLSLVSTILPSVSVQFLEAITRELSLTPLHHFDSVFLPFLKKWVSGVLSGAVSFVRAALLKLQQLESSEEADHAVAEILANAASVLQDETWDTFQRHLSQARLGSLKSLKFIATFLDEFQHAGLQLEHFVSPVGQFFGMCIAGIETALKDSETTLFVNTWLRCIDTVATREPMCAEQFEQLWVALMIPSMQSLFLSFLSQCVWVDRSTAGDLVNRLEISMEDMSLIDFAELERQFHWLSLLSEADYKGVFNLVARACVDFYDSEADTFEYESFRKDGIMLLTLCPVLVGESARELSTSYLIQFHVHNNVPDSVSFSVIWLMKLLLGNFHTPSVLRLLLDLFKFKEKYELTLWHEEELEQVVEEVLVQDFPWLALLEPDAYDTVKDDIRECAELNRVPFHCVIFRGGSATELPRLSTKIFSPLNLKVFTESSDIFRCLSQLLRILTPPELLIAWELFRRILPETNQISEFIEVSPTYSKLRKGLHLTDRLIWLQAISCLSDLPGFPRRFSAHKADIKQLFDSLVLDQDLISILQRFSYLFVVYCDLLLELMSIYYWAYGEATSADTVKRTLEILEAVSKYYACSESEAQLVTMIFSHAEVLCRQHTEWLDLRPQVEQVLKLSLIDSKEAHFRQASFGFFSSLSARQDQFAEEVASVLLGLCDFVLGREEVAEHYFLLLGKVLQGRDDSGVLTTLVERMLCEEFFWTKTAPGREVLLKTIAALQSSLTIEAKERLAEVLVSWLFHYDSRHCFSMIEASAAIVLLSVLGRSDPGVQSRIAQCFAPFFRTMSWRHRDPESWSLKYSLEVLSKGVVNLGATCYIATTLHLLNALDSFTCALFEVDSQSSLLQCLGEVLAELRWKKAGAVSIERLASLLAVKPVEQMDIEEFYNSLMLQIEAHLATTKHAGLVAAQFRGTLRTTLTCQGACGGQREVSQDFLSLTLPFRGKTNLQESLAAMVRGELLGGENAIQCEACGCSASAVSVQRLERLPSVMVCSLRRFEYDMETGTRKKLTDYFEFPEEVDFSPYCVEQSAEHDCRYRLRGVAVHMGEAQFGHYYALVRSADHWTRFNDQTVESPVLDIRPEAFGGSSSSSAYVLVYTKTDRPEHLPQAPHITALRSKLEAEMEASWQLHALLSPFLHKYMTQVLGSPALDVRMLKFVLCYFLTIHVRKAIWSHSTAFLEKLLAKVEEVAGCSPWVLEVLSDAGVLEEFLVACPVLAVKKAFVLILRASLKSASEPFAARCMSRFLAKISRLTSIRSQAYAHLFEALGFLIAKFPDQARKLHISKYLVAKLFNIESGIEEFAAQNRLFTNEVYLGHPCSEFDTDSESVGKAHVGFQLMAVNKALHPEEVEWLLIMISPTRLRLSTYFERKQFALLLHSCFKVQPDAVKQMLASWVAVLGFPNSEAITRFFEVAHLLVNASSGALLECVLTSLAQEKLTGEVSAVDTWVQHLYRLYYAFPKAKEWQEEGLLLAMQTWNSTSEQLLCILSQQQDNLPSPISFPQDFYERRLGDGVKLEFSVNNQKQIGRVLKSFELVHVVQAANQVLWVAGEQDITCT